MSPLRNIFGLGSKSATSNGASKIGSSLRQWLSPTVQDAAPAPAPRPAAVSPPSKVKDSGQEKAEVVPQQQQQQQGPQQEIHQEQVKPFRSKKTLATRRKPDNLAWRNNYTPIKPQPGEAASSQHKVTDAQEPFGVETAQEIETGGGRKTSTQTWRERKSVRADFNNKRSAWKSPLQPAALRSSAVKRVPPDSLVWRQPPVRGSNWGESRYRSRNAESSRNTKTFRNTGPFPSSESTTNIPREPVQSIERPDEVPLQTQSEPSRTAENSPQPRPGHLRYVSLTGFPRSTTLCDVLRGIAQTAPVGRIKRISFRQPSNDSEPRDVKVLILFDNIAAPYDLYRLSKSGAFFINGVQIRRCRLEGPTKEMQAAQCDKVSRTLVLSGRSSLQGFDAQNLLTMVMDRFPKDNPAIAWLFRGLEFEPIKQVDFGNGRRRLVCRFVSKISQVVNLKIGIETVFEGRIRCSFGRDPCWDPDLYPWDREPVVVGFPRKATA
ncbi:hypothetical protein BD289DRAFT_481817 [Coniella lustricola]|uniref:Uncharacterized protein n=1 Tax=Coniella lustricola TaxID=2025994 RepID=A0A2T3AAV3_9PEZI|nr:hypothetical protein BD289DRAFT_481817 [Coniella lustricola]